MGAGSLPSTGPHLWRAGPELSPGGSHGGSLSSGWAASRGGPIPLIWAASPVAVARFVRPIGRLGPEIQFLFGTPPQRNASKN